MNMVEILSHWNIYVPETSFLTQRGATIIFNEKNEVLYNFIPENLLGYSSNMTSPLSFLEEILFNWTLMISNKCLVCGSYNFRADRALSGRLVCNSCGTPFGVRGSGNIKINNFNIFSFKNKYFFFVCILIVSFIIVII